MHLVHLEITNFRSIKSLSFDLKHGANLLVGPNASGKSTVLEAIRLAKAILAPRTQNESRQVLAALGAMTPTQQMNFAAIAGDPKKAIKINCTYELTEEQIKILPDITRELASSLIAAQQGIDLTAPNGELNMAQLLSTPVGKNAYSQALQGIQEPLGKFIKNKQCKLFASLEPNGSVTQGDVISQLLFSVLERRLPPSRTRFSYFPADRALTTGDAQIQIGAADAQQQLESHNSQPALKYQRLKNVIFSTILSGSEAATEQSITFTKLFAGLLKEKSLRSADVNRFGQASVMIHDDLLDQTFDIDSMSSGEKGVVLTLLLIARSIEPSGLVLLDEPELHLNSGVCKNLLDFLLDEFCLPNNIQVILCTHSPEVMTSALRREDCSVFNMRRDGPASLIRQRDHAEAMQALRQLGTTEIEALLFDAVVFVEGPDDVELLEYAFRDLLSRLKFKELTGRGEVEKYIRLLIEADNAGKAENTAFFVFDRDNKPTALHNTKHVKLKQWGRYCLENYIIEPEILYDTVRQDLKPRNWPSSYGEALELFASVAKRQLEGRIVEATFRDLGLQDIRLRSEDKKGSFSLSAASLVTKLLRLRSQTENLAQDQWMAEFTERCNQRLVAEEAEWSQNWIGKCNGKQFLLDIYTHAAPKVDLTTFKRSLLLENRNKDSQSWLQLSATIKDLVRDLK